MSDNMKVDREEMRKVEAACFAADRLRTAFDRHGIDVEPTIDDDGYVKVEMNSLETNRVTDFLNAVADSQRPRP